MSVTLVTPTRTKPFLKWVGGKTQIIEKVMSKFPTTMNSYHEPFVGGGSVLFALLDARANGDIMVNGSINAYDANPLLIEVYQQIQTNKDRLFAAISRYMVVYAGITGTEINRVPKNMEEAMTSQESYYYWMRTKFNDSATPPTERAALFMVLNKTGFRGMYREGPNGFNIPFGHYKRTPQVTTKDSLDAVSALIADVEFKVCDFGDAFIAMRSGDFVYADPPYAPETAKSFVGYTADGFGLETHERLFGCLLGLGEKNISFVMSNARVDMVVDKFVGCDIDTVVARRAINSKNPGATTEEVLVYVGC